MKILMVAPEPFFEPRGTPFSEYYRIKALSEIGHHIDLITYPIGKDVKIKNLKIKRILKIPFIKNIKIGPSFKKIFLDLFLFPKAFFYAIFKKYDFVHTHEEAGYLGAFLNKFFNIPHLYDMHSSLSQQMTNFNFTKSKIIINILKKLEKFVLNNSDSVITICPALYNHASKSISKDKVFLIENFLDQEFELNRKRIKEIKEIFPQKKLALYAGTLEHYQGIDLLIKASNLIDDNIGILVLGGNKSQIKEIKNKFKLNEDKIKFLGKVEKRDVANFTEATDILLSPRKKGTNTPLKIYSYLKSGKPVVATKILSHTQILDKNIAILVSPSPEGIKQGIKKALTQDGKKISKNAFEFAKKNFTYDRYIKKVTNSIEIFNKQNNKLENQ